MHFPVLKAVFLRAVILPAAAVMLLLSVFVGLILHFSTSQSDALALARQSKLLNVVIQDSIARVAKDQEASTLWDDAVLQLRQRPLDQEWLDNNLGVWFHTYYRHDETYVLDGGNRPVYAMQRGRRAEPESFSRIAAEATPLVSTLRRSLRTGYGTPKGSPGQTIGTYDVAMVDGRPAIVSVKPIVSETGHLVQKAGSENLHISIRYLDRDFMQTLATDYGIERPKFVEEAREGTATLPVVGNDGKTIGFVSWRPFRPGKQVENKMVPVLFVALALIGALIVWLLARLIRGRRELEASRAQAQHLAFHDALTGLPNRALFDDRLDRALGRERGTAQFAVLQLDLDRFKNVNDTLGHPAGDALIREFARRLAAIMRDEDTVARLGGDEFGVLVERSNGRELDRLCTRILDAVNAPFDLFGNEAFVGVSIGVAFSAGRNGEKADLLRRADIALYRAKEDGRNCYRLFTPAMDETVQLRSTVEDDLRSALSTGNGLCIHYQPQVSGPENRIVGFEALLRWSHPVKGMIAPAQFVPVAEDTGLIVPLGEWVFSEACEASKRWPRHFISVNLSPVQFRVAGFADTLLKIVTETGADPRKIQLEVTERVLMDADHGATETLTELRKAGFVIVLDDFGTGYSSLSYLRKFHIDKIKIDRSFVEHLGISADSTAIVAAVLSLGHAMGVEVSAEGVETGTQRAFLQGAGCSEMQGYLFSRAVPEDELAALVAAALPNCSAA